MAQNSTVTAPAAAQPKATASAKKSAKKASDQAAATTPTVASSATTTVDAILVDNTAPAGTSTVETAAAEPSKKWSGSVQLYSNTDSQSTYDVQTLTTMTAGYKVLPKLSIKAAQTFETLSQRTALTGDAKVSRENKINDSNFRPAYFNFILGTSVDGIFGSDPISLSINHKNMNGDAYYVTKGGYASIHSQIEASAATNYTFNPNWSASVYAQWRHNVSKAGPQANSNRALVIPSLTYTFNDFVSVYQSAGVIASFTDNDQLRNAYQRAYLGTGVTVNPLKSLSISGYVAQDKAYYASAASGYEVSNFTPYKATNASTADATFDSVSYEVIATMSF